MRLMLEAGWHDWADVRKLIGMSRADIRKLIYVRTADVRKLIT
jgi:hypothetical protein